MKKEKFILYVLLSLFTRPCISQSIEWANANNNAGHYVATDAVVNSYEKTKSR